MGPWGVPRVPWPWANRTPREEEEVRRSFHEKWAATSRAALAARTEDQLPYNGWNGWGTNDIGYLPPPPPEGTESP